MTSYYLASEGAPQSLYVLDRAKGAHQQVSDLLKVFNHSGWDLSFDSSVGNSTLFVSTCNAYHGDGPNQFQQGPGTIISEPALGGPQTTVYTNPTLAITAVHVISRTTMLLLIQNSTGDTSHNGLWKMNLDGSRYALESDSTNEDTLLIGSLAGTSPSTFATVSSTVGQVFIVGWTTM